MFNDATVTMSIFIDFTNEKFVPVLVGVGIAVVPDCVSSKFHFTDVIPFVYVGVAPIPMSICTVIAISLSPYVYLSVYLFPSLPFFWGAPKFDRCPAGHQFFFCYEDFVVRVGVRCSSHRVKQMPRLARRYSILVSVGRRLFPLLQLGSRRFNLRLHRSDAREAGLSLHRHINRRSLGYREVVDVVIDWLRIAADSIHHGVMHISHSRLPYVVGSLADALASCGRYRE